MAARQRSQISALLVLLTLSLAPNPLRAQGARGTVKSAPLTVYAQMSPDSDVLATLAPAKAVLITFSVTTGDGTWCSVSDIDSAKKLGFVRCAGLNRQSGSSGAEVVPGVALSSSDYQTAIAGTPSRAQKNWAIATTAMLAAINHESIDTLSTGDSLTGVRRLLQNAWGISSRDDLLQTLDRIDKGGHREMFSALGARTADLTPDQLKAAVSRLSPEDANTVTVAHRYYGKYATQSLTGWDYIRYISLCRWGVTAGYLSEEDAWPPMMHAAQILQQTFTSWNELGENYLVGREFWSLRQTKADGAVMRSIYRRLLSNPDSPWNRIPWNLSLQISSSNLQNSPTSPSAGSSTAASSCDALLQAAETDKVSGVESILQTEPDLVKCRDSRGWTPLHYAAFRGQTKTIQVLIAHGGAVNAIDKDGATPLHEAATSNFPDTIEALLENGARIDAVDRHGDTPLQDATMAGSGSAVDALLRHHASTEIRSSNGYTPLQNAAYRGDTDVARLLLDHGARIESRDNDGFTPLSTAVTFEQTKMVEFLLMAGANVDTRSKHGMTPLYGAAANGYVGIATLLLDHGAHPNIGDEHGFTPLHTAADHNQTGVAEVLIQHGAAINARTDAGDTPLHWAAYDNRMDAASLLIQHGAEVNPKDRDGNTPLHWAAARGHVEMTELLIAHGGDLKAKTRFGCTPLRGAYDYHQTATAQVLLRHGAPQ